MRLAWQIARDTWKAGGASESFGTLLANYIRQGGYVVNFPDLFIAAMPVRLSEEGQPVSPPCGKDADTWFVHLASVTPDFVARGEHPVAAFLRLAPFRLPFATWQRRGQGLLRRYRTDRLARFRPPQHEHECLDAPPA